MRTIRRRLGRRAFVGGCVALGAAAAGLLVGAADTRSHQRSSVARVGFLGNRAIDVPELGEAFRNGLRELGWVAGENLTIEWRYSDGMEPWLPDVAAELAQAVDVVVVGHAPAALAMQRANATLPIVLVNHPDPVGAGLAASFARPGGTITGNGGPGVSNGKKVQLLKETIPSLARIGVLVNPDFSAAVARTVHLPQVYEVAGPLAVEVIVAESRDQADLAAALDGLVHQRADGLLVIDAPNLVAQRAAIVEFAAAARLAAVYPNGVWVEAGGLMSYGNSVAGLHRRAAWYVDRLLRGARPADLPIQQQTEYELIVNAGAARRLGLTFPPSVEVQVTHWIT